MKHPEELKTKFLELRARDVSYSRIAEELQVSKPTLIQWGRDLADEIADLQAAERELVREKLLGNFEQWLARQVHHFNRLDAEFGRREFKYSPTESVFRMMMASRKLLDRYFFEDDRPRSRRAKSDQPSEGRAPSSPPAAAPTELHTSVKGRAARLSRSIGAPPAAASTALEGGVPRRQDQPPTPDHQSPIAKSKSEIERNPSKIQPFPHRNEGAGTSVPPLDHSHNLAPNPIASPSSDARTDAANLPLPRAAETKSLRRSNDPKLGTGEGQTGTLDPGPASWRLCVEANSPEPGVETQNPAKTLPFPCQNSGPHNNNLSAHSAGPEAPDLSNRGSGALGNSGSTPPWCPRRPDTPLRQSPSGAATMQNSPPPPSEIGAGSQITYPQSHTESDGESIPFSPYESTREWLERQGINVPKDARIITAG